MADEGMRAKRKPRMWSGRTSVELDSGDRAHVRARELRDRLIEQDLRAKRESLLNTLFNGTVRVTKRGDS